jgi:hypothetical protein
MDAGITIEVVDVDPDYLGLSVRVWNDRYCGSTYIFAAPGQLAAFAEAIAGFPRTLMDDRFFELGRLRGLRFAGGYCRFDLQYRAPAEGAWCRVLIQDEVQRFGDATATLTLPIEAAGVDRLASSLRAVEQARAGTAVYRLSD